MTAFTGFQGRNLATLAAADAYRFERGRAEAEAADDADAALRTSLANLGPNASRDELLAAVTPTLAKTRGGGSTLMSLHQSGADARAAAAAKADERAYQAQRDEASHQLQLERLGMQQDRQDARTDRTIAASQAAAAQRAALEREQRENAVEMEIARMLGNGDVEAARFLRDQNGVEVPDEVLSNAARNAELREVMKLVAETGDPAYGEQLLAGFDQTGTYEGALRAAGLPPAASSQATTALLTREGKIEDYMRTFGVDRESAITALENQEATITGSDGRVYRHNKITGTLEDVTPSIAGYDSLPERENVARVGGDLEDTVGAGPRTAEIAARTIGQFVPGVISEDVEENRQALRLLERQARSAFANSARPSQWEQSLIRELFPSEGFFESPQRAAIMLRRLQDEAAQTYNDYGKALADPSIQGAFRNELMQKRLELERLVEAIDIPDDEYERLMQDVQRSVPASGSTSGGVGWRIVE